MRRSVLVLGLAVLAAPLGACGSFGAKTDLSLADLTSRCEGRGGRLMASGVSTGVPRQDHYCLEVGMNARADLNEFDVRRDTSGGMSPTVYRAPEPVAASSLATSPRP